MLSVNLPVALPAMLMLEQVICEKLIECKARADFETEYAGECYCDSQLRAGGAPAPDGNTGCNMACSGNATEMCGGPNRLTLWRFYTGSEPTGSVSVTAASSKAVPVATGLPTGFTYKGCYVDGPGFRIMNYQQPDDQAMTIASCANVCAKAGYTIAAMEVSDMTKVCVHDSC